MLFKWFLDLNVDDSPFHASTFSKNQERLLSQDVARRFLRKKGLQRGWGPSILID